MLFASEPSGADVRDVKDRPLFEENRDQLGNQGIQQLFGKDLIRDILEEPQLVHALVFIGDPELQEREGATSLQETAVPEHQNHDRNFPIEP